MLPRRSLLICSPLAAVQHVAACKSTQRTDVFRRLIQLLAGMWEIWRNNMFGGVALSSYGGFWMGFAIVGESSSLVNEPLQPCHQQIRAVWAVLQALSRTSAIWGDVNSWPGVLPSAKRIQAVNILNQYVSACAAVSGLLHQVYMLGN